MNWLSENWIEVGQAVMAVFGGISIFVRLTPTVQDDEIVDPIMRFLSKLFQGSVRK